MSRKKDFKFSPLRKDKISGYKEFMSNLDTLSFGEQRQFHKKYNLPNKSYFENARNKSHEDDGLFSVG